VPLSGTEVLDAPVGILDADPLGADAEHQQALTPAGTVDVAEDRLTLMRSLL
jgi:hypothetical protein